MMKKVFTLMTVFIAGGLGAIVSFGKNEGSRMPGVAGGKQQSRSVPMLLVENKGQIADQHGRARKDIDFRTGNDQVQVFIGEGGVHYQWAAPAGVSKDQHDRIRLYRMDVELLGCNKKAEVVKETAGNYEERYYMGKAPVTAGAYERVTYKEVLPHIDWTFYCNREGRLEYDFIIHPGGKVSDIKLRYNGAGSLKIDAKGNLIARTPQGMLTEAAPRSYTQGGTTVASAFMLKHNVLGFTTAQHKGTLVIDPTVAWATYYGGDAAGAGALWTSIDRMTTDGVGNSYIAGRTTTVNNIATSGTYQSSFPGDYIMYMACINASGQRVWGTYYGSDVSTIADMVCDKDNNLYIAGMGRDALPGFTSPGSHQETLHGNSDAFLIKLNPTGNREWATFYGGSTETHGSRVTCDRWGNVYLAGTTYSSSDLIYPNAIATPGAHKTNYNDNVAQGDRGDAFLVKFNSQGQRIWGTYFGGDQKELLSPMENTNSCYGGLACDLAGNVYLAGSTMSTGQIAFGTSHQATYAGATPSNYEGDGFLVKFDSSGQVIWGTYYGGSKSERVSDLVSDASGNLFLVGKTESTSGIASPGAFKTSLGSIPANTDLLFIARFDTAGARQWGTYYGEYSASSAWHYLQLGGAATDVAGKLWISGVTDSDAGLTTSNGLYPSMAGNSSAYLVQFNPQNGYPVWGSYYSDGPMWQFANVACNPFGAVYLSCESLTNGWATPNTHLDTYPAGVGETGLLTRFDDCDSTLASIVLPSVTGDTLVCPGAQVTYSIPDVATTYNWSLPAGWTGSSDSAKIIVTAGTVAGNISVSANFSCGSSNQRTLHVGLYPLPVPVISLSGVSLTTGTFTGYQWYLNGTLINGATAATFNPTQSGSYTVKVTSSDGCQATSPAYSYNGVGIDGKSAAGGISLYPNPAQDKIYIRAPYAVNVSIHDMSGRQLKWQRRAGTMALGDLPAGLYLVKVWNTNDQLLYVEKLVKNR